MLTFTKARCLCRIHYGLINGLYGEDTPKAGMTMGEVGHEGGPSERATVVVVRLALRWNGGVRGYQRRTYVELGIACTA